MPSAVTGPREDKAPWARVAFMKLHLCVRPWVSDLSQLNLSQAGAKAQRSWNLGMRAVEIQTKAGANALTRITMASMEGQTDFPLTAGTAYTLIRTLGSLGDSP